MPLAKALFGCLPYPTAHTVGSKTLRDIRRLRYRVRRTRGFTGSMGKPLLPDDRRASTSGSAECCIEGAEEDSRRRVGRGLMAGDLERVLQHYPGDVVRTAGDCIRRAGHRLA